MTDKNIEKFIKYVPTADEGLYYPETDGRPLAETDLHRVVIYNTNDKLETFYAAQNDVYVSGNLLIYDIPGKTTRSISPDIMVVFGIEKKMRRTYKIWEEGKAPDFVMEVSSKWTYRNDLTRKEKRYAHIGVNEYFLYDPERAYLPESLIGLRLTDGGEYEPIPITNNNGIISNVLGIEFRILDEDIELHNLSTGEVLQTAAEKANEIAKQEAEARQQEAEARQQEVEARQKLEAELAQLKSELRRLKGMQNSSEN